MSNDILQARDDRVKQIEHLLTHNKTIIVVKANTPGKNKNISEAHFLVRFFRLEIKKQLNLANEKTYQSIDGPYFIATVKNNSTAASKSICIKIEDSHPLGRFIDIDVFAQARQPLSRLDKRIKPRSCYLCDNSAFYCARNKTHSIESLTQFMQKSIMIYLDNRIASLIKDAMLKELSLEHKFGLVTKTSSGSHSDMDYDLMIKAQDVIIPHLVSLFSLGYKASSLDTLLDQTRAIGLKAEKAMLEKTKGVNCYKGLIFVLGITILSVAYTLKHNQSFDKIFSNIKQISRCVCHEFEQTGTSFGLSAYHNHRLRGIRGEVSQGLKSVQSALKTFKTTSATDLRKVLKHLILACEDTVLLKRAGSITSYYEVKKQISNLDINDYDAVINYTEFTIANKLSFGGSADLLIVSLFLKSLKEESLII